MVIIVKIDGNKYMVDTGFGSMGACSPIRLRDREIVENIPTAEGRVVHRNIDPNTDPDQRLWIYESRDNRDAPWKPCYCFTELEFLPQDFEGMSFKTSQSRKSWFTYRLVLTHILLEEDDGKPSGTMTLAGSEVKKRLEGKNEVLATCQTEEERVTALKKHFGVELRDDERRGIHGMVTELKKRGM